MTAETLRDALEAMDDALPCHATDHRTMTCTYPPFVAARERLFAAARESDAWQITAEEGIEVADDLRAQRDAAHESIYRAIQAREQAALPELARRAAMFEAEYQRDALRAALEALKRPVIPGIQMSNEPHPPSWNAAVDACISALAAKLGSGL